MSIKPWVATAAGLVKQLFRKLAFPTSFLLAGVLLGAAGACWWGWSLETKKQQSTILLKMGTGAPDGVYHNIGDRLVLIIQQEESQSSSPRPFTLKNVSTEGSLDNLQRLLSRRDSPQKLDLAIVQSDTLASFLMDQAQGIAGEKPSVDSSGVWANKLAPFFEPLGRLIERDNQRSPHPPLWILMPLHDELVTLVTKTRIHNLGEFAGERIAFGKENSGSARNAKTVLDAANVSIESNESLMALRASKKPFVIHVSEEYGSVAEAMIWLKQDRIDGFFTTVGHPSGVLNDGFKSRPEIFHILPLARDPSLTRRDGKVQMTHFQTMVLPEYEGTSKSEKAETFGVTALLCCRPVKPFIADQDEDGAHFLMNAFLAHYKNIMTHDKALENLEVMDVASMAEKLEARDQILRRFWHPWTRAYLDGARWFDKNKAP